MDRGSAEREAKRRAEMLEGRRRTTKTMMEGVIDQLCADYGIDKSKLEFNTTSPDIRKWEIGVTLAPGVKQWESLWVFPSDEIRTMLMLVSK